MIWSWVFFFFFNSLMKLKCIICKITTSWHEVTIWLSRLYSNMLGRNTTGSRHKTGQTEENGKENVVISLWNTAAPLHLATSCTVYLMLLARVAMLNSRLAFEPHSDCLMTWKTKRVAQCIFIGFINYDFLCYAELTVHTWIVFVVLSVKVVHTYKYVLHNMHLEVCCLYRYKLTSPP